MQPHSTLPNRLHRNRVIGHATDKLGPDPGPACRRYRRSRSNWWGYPGVNSSSPACLPGFLFALHATFKPVAMMVDAWSDPSCRGEIALDDNLAMETGEAP